MFMPFFIKAANKEAKKVSVLSLYFLGVQVLDASFSFKGVTGDVKPKEPEERTCQAPPPLCLVWNEGISSRDHRMRSLQKLLFHSPIFF